MTIEDVAHDALNEVHELRGRLSAELKEPIQFPEPAPVLDLESRKGSRERMFKHLHQSSIGHRENFCASSEIKHLYLIDAYLDLAKTKNGLGLYAIARSMFELNAFLHEIRRRLVAAASHSASDWLAAGQQFFGLVVRARFATTHPDYREVLRAEGIPTNRLKPFNIKNCVQKLGEHPDHVDAEERYAVLCDFVHHNLASATTTNAGSATADVARSSGGGGIVMPGGGTVTQYQYPLPKKYERAVNDTAPGFLRDVESCIQWINEIPASPYRHELIEKFTGSRLGVSVLRPPGPQT